MDDFKLEPKNQKSNLDIKNQKRKRKKVSSLIKKRRDDDLEKVLNSDIIFGLDNGATGTISCLIPYDKNNIKIYFEKTFSHVDLDYQKDINYIARIDWEKLKDWFNNNFTPFLQTVAITLGNIVIGVFDSFNKDRACLSDILPFSRAS